MLFGDYMKRIEIAIYNFIKNVPFLKDFVKYTYQLLLSLFVKKKHVSIDPIVTRRNAFFGFHDKSPWSPSGQMLLANIFSGKGNEPLAINTPQEIAIFSGQDWVEKRIIADTRAWNWQQGSQLQWLDDERLLFNDFLNKKCVARILGFDGKEKGNLPFPVGAVHTGTLMYASFCYETFGAAMPGYGYNFAANDASSGLKPMELVIGHIKNPGDFWSLDCNDLGTRDWSIGAHGNYCVSHTQFSPSGRYLAFMKRLNQKGIRLKSEIFLLDLETRNVTAFPFQDMVSHYCFINDSTLLAYGSISGEGDGFYVVDITTMSHEKVTEFLNNRDGHPTCSMDGVVAFDTYPDGSRHQELYLWRNRKVQANKIATLYAPLSFRGSTRVDLHPRISPDGKYLCFDTSFSGVRSLSTMTLLDEA